MTKLLKRKISSTYFSFFEVMISTTRHTDRQTDRQIYMYINICILREREKVRKRE